MFTRIYLYVYYYIGFNEIKIDQLFIQVFYIKVELLIFAHRY